MGFFHKIGDALKKVAHAVVHLPEDIAKVEVEKAKMMLNIAKKTGLKYGKQAHSIVTGK